MTLINMGQTGNTTVNKILSKVAVKQNKNTAKKCNFGLNFFGCTDNDCTRMVRAH